MRMNDDSTATKGLGACLARGGSAEVFALSEARVLKLFRLGIPPVVAEREADYAMRARAAGLPLPIVFGLETWGDRHGVVFERVAGPTILRVISTNTAQAGVLGSLLAELNARVHELSGSGFPSRKEQLAMAIARAPGIDQAHRASALATLSRLPDEETLCHGELHPGNVILAEHGPVIVDWKGASRGSSLSDVARVVLAIKAGEAKDDPVPDAARSAVLASFLRRYREIRPFAAGDLNAWLPIMALSPAAKFGPLATEARASVS
jgi:aminoglycoside phosphotransferase (APT) family kinase protein